MGQQLNRDKTTIFFSKATHAEVQEDIIQILGVLEIKQYEKCLGLPFFVGRKKKASFMYIKGRVWSKLGDGKRSFFLKRVGRCF